VVCTCEIAALFQTGFDGIISASITGSAEFIDIISECSTGVNVIPTLRKKLIGPSVGNINITAYAFTPSTVNKFLGVACPSQAGIDFPIQQRFDCMNDMTWLIRLKTGQAFTEGDNITGISLFGNICSFRTVNASAQSGPSSRVIDTTKFIGTDLVWAGPPFPFDSRDVTTLDFNIFGLLAKLTNFNVSVTVPSVATNTYTFLYSIPSCSNFNIIQVP